MYRWLLVLLCFIPHCVYPSCTGQSCQQGTQSSGDVKITLHSDEQLRVWGLKNLELVKGSGGVYGAQQLVCGYSSVQAGRVSVVSQNNMNLSGPGGIQIPYRLRLRKTSSDPVWHDLIPGQFLSIRLGETIKPDSNCGSDANIRLWALLLENSVDLVAGNYSDIVTVTLSPE
ncbi:hypothetical protein [Parendozoicomonas sp. Alg238-R29]|uniref:hypothetical protein n=1 Tax=Parendozoicomonas sp. Alg238-R29 TaxID=2993446 RepID=UPI00248DAA71|nr:hypothetical protein [Parendozoicomonas sp. Alg238-R29]